MTSNILNQYQVCSIKEIANKFNFSTSYIRQLEKENILELCLEMFNNVKSYSDIVFKYNESDLFDLNSLFSKQKILKQNINDIFDSTSTKLCSKEYLKKYTYNYWIELLFIGHNSNPLLIAEKGLILSKSQPNLYKDLTQKISNLELSIMVYNLTNKQKISSSSTLILERISKGEKIDHSEITEELKKYL